MGISNRYAQAVVEVEVRRNARIHRREQPRDHRIAARRRATLMLARKELDKGKAS